MLKVYEHTHDADGYLEDNYELMDLLEEIECKYRKVPIVEYFDIAADVYIGNGEYFVYCKLSDDGECCDAYVNSFDDKDELIYYLVDITGENYKYLDKLIR